MLKKIALLTAILFLVTMIGTAMAQSEDEIIAKYLKKTEKKHKKKVGFFSAHFLYGILKKDLGYQSFDFTGSSDLATISGTVAPHQNLYRSKELGMNLGMMLTPKSSFTLGFDYWLTLGTKVTVDKNAMFGTLSVPELYVEDAEVKVYGAKIGFNYYFLNQPDQYGKINSIAITAGAGAGYYWASWDVWSEDDADSEPLKANSVGYWLQAGLEYPLGLMDMTIGAEFSYFLLNFSNLNAYNQDSGDLTLSTLSDGEDLALDFSGPRGKIVLKKFIVW